ncbi:insulin-like growth factor-binding protein 3 receptor isoform X3 [Mixophyes fleayi]|uniref:insulin-like growth factor-binding protein 3 receptor isoform X3 n=1 Tax=Mixophyes fleayi TaxID=3061075 RepID=UPI003F4E1BA2
MVTFRAWLPPTHGSKSWRPTKWPRPACGDTCGCQFPWKHVEVSRARRHFVSSQFRGEQPLRMRCVRRRGRESSGLVLRLRPATLAGGSYTGNMCHCRPCQGIRSSVLRHPPVATFFLCLVTLSVTFLSYGAYIQTHSVKDFTQDWDSFLRTLSLKKICPQGNMTSSSPDLTVGPSKVPAVHTEGLGSVSVLAGIMLSPWQLAVNHTGLRIYTTGGQLGMRGLSADAHLTVTVTSGRWSVQCNNSDTECSVRYCVTVTGPSSLLPRTRSSPSCPESISSDQLLLDLYVVKDGPDTSSKCYHLVYNGDTVLENMVPQKERTLIFHRLMLTSISLLTLGVFLCLVSAFCNQPPRMDKWTHVAL